MSSSVASVPQPAAVLSGRHRRAWLEWIEWNCGLHIAESRQHVLDGSLRARMEALGVPDHEQYFHRVAIAGDKSEARLLLERLLNNETRFFRHLPSFTALGEYAIPKLLRTVLRVGGMLRMWSAGCSTGEEAFSMAATALNTAGTAARITGSDWSEAALDRARKARWNKRLMVDIPEPYRSRYFRGCRDSEAAFEPQPFLRECVRFTDFNFVDPHSYPAGPFHVIFCQNVLIYFHDSVRSRVVANLSQRLAPGGMLFTGPGELMYRPLPGLEPVRVGSTVLFEKAGE